MPVTAMNHFTVLTDDLERTLYFYVGILGLSSGPRPPLGFPGAWLYAGEHPILHVIADRPLPAERRGVLDHLAFSARGLSALTKRLTAGGFTYETRRQPETGVWQLFTTDPNGARVELDFDPSEPGPQEAA